MLEGINLYNMRGSRHDFVEINNHKETYRQKRIDDFNQAVK